MSRYFRFEGNVRVVARVCACALLFGVAATSSAAATPTFATARAAAASAPRTWSTKAKTLRLIPRRSQPTVGHGPTRLFLVVYYLPTPLPPTLAKGRHELWARVARCDDGRWHLTSVATAP